MTKIPVEVERPSSRVEPRGSDVRPPRPPGGQRRRFRPIYLVLLLLAALLFVVWKVNHSRPGYPGARPGGGRRAYTMTGPLPVGVRQAEKGDLNLYLDGLGTVTPLATVTVRTQIAGVLEEVDFKEGQTVKKGDLLAIIDPRPYQVALEQAEGNLLQAQSQLSEAKTDLVRYQTLAKEDSIALQQVDTQRFLVNQYEGLVRTDQAAIDNAKLNLTYCHITAPVTGRVGLRQIDPGNYVAPSDANGLVVLTQLQPISVIFTLPEDDIPQIAARLKAGAILPVEAYDRTDTTKLASGTLATIDNQIDTTTGMLRLRADFDNADQALFPNQFVNVRMLVDVDRGATLIPTSGIEHGQQGTFVYLVKPDSTVTAQAVKLGPTEGERAAVVSGLSVGDRIVVDGADKLKEGMKVIVQGSGPAAGPGGAPAWSPSPGGKGGHRRHRPAGGSDGR